MEQYLQHILQYLHARPGLGELFAFLVAFAESLPVVGTIIPGTITMTVVGVLIGTGAVSGLLTLGLTSLAAFIGDCCGFILGRYCDGRIRTIWPFRKHPKWLAMGETFFEKHGGKSVAIIVAAIYCCCYSIRRAMGVDVHHSRHHARCVICRSAQRRRHEIFSVWIIIFCNHLVYFLGGATFLLATGAISQSYH